MKRLVFLDDIRQPQDTFNYTKNMIYSLDWKIVRTFDEFVKDTLENGVASIYSFDHDLANEHYFDGEIKIDKYESFSEKTGYHCAKWLIEHCIENNINIPDKIFIHSMNPHGSANIESLFKTYAKIFDVVIEIKRYL